MGDLTRFRQTVVNILNNACKFTPQTGNVSLSLSISTEDEAPKGCIMTLLRIADTGIGMSSEVLSRLFDEFFQGEVSTTRRFGGTGLGLAIVKQLTEASNMFNYHEMKSI
jgi:two-component system sensor histidine kinase/response regulator